MTCKYLSDEFTAVCTNADCPCKADACPCLNYPQICKYAAEKRNPEMDMKIEELCLSVRAYNALKRANINTVGEILQKTPDQLIRTRSIGEKVFKEIWHKVEAAGYNICLHDDKTTRMYMVNCGDRSYSQHEDFR